MILRLNKASYLFNIKSATVAGGLLSEKVKDYGMQKLAEKLLPSQHFNTVLIGKKLFIA
jgi:hypothetical protein